MSAFTKKIARTLIRPFHRALVGTVYSPDYIFSTFNRKRQHILIVAAPKSGSTWLTEVLHAALPGHKTRSMLPAYGRREQELSLGAIARHVTRENVLGVHQHLRYSGWTGKVLEEAGIRPVLRIRNIFDTVYSIHDHIGENYEGPMAYLDPGVWANLKTREERFEFIVNMVLPWFFSFYATWLTSDWYRQGRVVVSAYEDMRREPVEHVQGLLAQLGISVDREAVEQAWMPPAVGSRERTRRSSDAVSNSPPLCGRRSTGWPITTRISISAA